MNDVDTTIPCEMNLNKGNTLSLTFQNDSPVVRSGDLPPGIVFNEKVLSGSVTASTGIYTSQFTASPVLTLTFIVSEIPCFLSVSRILMEDGTYTPIEKIKHGDMVVSAFSNTPVKVKRCGYTIVKFTDIEKTNLPYTIPKSYFSDDVPTGDVYVSGHHRIVNKTDNSLLGVQTFKMVNSIHAVTEYGSDTIRYYHIELEGGVNAVYSEGLALETMNEYEWDKTMFIEN